MKIHEIGKDLLILCSLIINSLMYLFSGLFRRNEKHMVFGAWGGNKYSDNPRYLLEALQKDPSLELYWVGKSTLKDLPIFQHRNVHFLKRGSLKAYLQILRSKNVYFSNSYRDLGYINLLNGATVTQLWHGFGLKNTLSAKKKISRLLKSSITT